MVNSRRTAPPEAETSGSGGSRPDHHIPPPNAPYCPPHEGLMHNGYFSDAGGEQWAILASLINTAKLHGIDPQTYLADVLERIVSGRTKANALAELLPWAWKAAREQPAAG